MSVSDHIQPENLEKARKLYEEYVLVRRHIAAYHPDVCPVEATAYTRVGSGIEPFKFTLGSGMKLLREAERSLAGQLTSLHVAVKPPQACSWEDEVDRARDLSNKVQKALLDGGTEFNKAYGNFSTVANELKVVNLDLLEDHFGYLENRGIDQNDIAFYGLYIQNGFKIPA